MNKPSKSFKSTIALAAALLALLALPLAGCSSADAADTGSTPIGEDAAAGTNLANDPALLAEELTVEDLVEGTGAEATVGSTATVHYTGWLTDGTKFDSSVDSGTPFSFTIGAGDVIAGWDQGVAGMKVGGKRKLTIPPSMGYGDTAVGMIPAGSTLVFEVELLEVK